ncbi:MAG TPA: NAD(P)/FAD-dependent oxidoreductase [Candidatus Methylacidiphilales bacterium]|jgi:flavin-dependent dehydrogenase|nr:NAD(P)/FAD-dependent oxidoreductase [Candidatus Methylacidiphilales bacterium]
MSHDVVIVGAAPAGSLAALVLAREGKRVALLDRASFPRAKVCGNCVNPSTWAIWRRLGLAEGFSRLPHHNAAGFAIHCEGRTVFEHDFPSPGRGPRSVSREVLDDWLRREAERAGAEFFPETTVTGLDAAAGIVTTSRGDFRGALVLGADGRNSLVARQAGLMPPPRRCHRVGWQAIIEAPAALDDHIHMHVFDEGYFGFSRFSETHAVISMVLDARRTQDPDRFARRYLPPFAPTEWRRLNPITRANAALTTGRVWLAGDAARVVEPFTGEGIGFALATGLLAAETALRGYGSAAYARAHRALYRRRAWVNLIAHWALVDPARTVRLVRRMQHLPRGLVTLLSRQVHATG